MFCPTIPQLRQILLSISIKNETMSLAYCLNYGGDAEYVDKDGRNAIHHFAIHGNHEAVARIAEEEDYRFFNTPDNFGMSPLMYMAQSGQGQLVADIIRKNPSFLQPHTEADKPQPEQSLVALMAKNGCAGELASIAPLLPAEDHKVVVTAVLCSTTLKPMEKVNLLRTLTAAGIRTDAV